MSVLHNVCLTVELKQIRDSGSAEHVRNPSRLLELMDNVWARAERGHRFDVRMTLLRHAMTNEDLVAGVCDGVAERAVEYVVPRCLISMAKDAGNTNMLRALVAILPNHSSTPAWHLMWVDDYAASVIVAMHEEIRCAAESINIGAGPMRVIADMVQRARK